MKRLVSILLILILSMTLAEAKVKVRLKNLVTIEGLRENQLIGYGIVTGLNGTGDSSRFKVTHKLMSVIMENLGIDTASDIVYSKNSALVIITANMPPNVQKGEKINVEVSSMGDAKSIAGGVLLQCPLKSANGTVYAVAQGTVSIADTDEKNRTTGIIPQGAIVETAVSAQFIKNNKMVLILNYPDFSLVNKIKEVISEKFTNINLSVLNDKSIEITIPDEYLTNYDKFLSDIQNLEVEPEPKAKIVINKNTGVVVISGDVKLTESAVSYKNIDIYIKKSGLYSAATNKEEEKKIFYLKDSDDIKSLIDGLNMIGAKTEDIIAILYALKDANALYGEIVVE